MNVGQRIATFNAGRDPERLHLKLTAMQETALSFLRGTCHLFYEDLNYAALPDSPLVWCCGDLHLNNFGTYKGDNRRTYFDVNDFDESCLAPLTWDLVRFLTSVIVAGTEISMDAATIRALLQGFLNGYAAALRKGKAEWLERATSEGMIRALIVRLKKRDRRKFLDSRTDIVKGVRELNRKHTLPLLQGESEMLRRFLSDFAGHQPAPSFFTFLDAARRIAGAGSLGLDRYVLLVNGRGGPHGNFLLDLKLAHPSCVPAGDQPRWRNNAERIAVTQTAVQAREPALLTPVQMNNRWWLLRELMPTGDRLDMTAWRNDADGFAHAVYTLGQVVAWGHLRASGLRGSALTETLIAFGGKRAWMTPLLKTARVCATRLEDQWNEFRTVPVAKMMA